MIRLVCASIRLGVCVCIVSGWSLRPSYTVKFARRTRDCRWRLKIAQLNSSDAFNCDCLKTEPARSLSACYFFTSLYDQLISTSTFFCFLFISSVQRSKRAAPKQVIRCYCFFSHVRLSWVQFISDTRSTWKQKIRKRIKYTVIILVTSWQMKW